MPTDAHGNSIQHRTVLLVDDEKMVLDVGKAILQRLGHVVITAESGQEALDQFARHREEIGCVVLDLSMPGMDGNETFNRLRAMDPEVPVIIASGMSAAQISGQFTTQAKTAVIQKPYRVADLSTQIQSLIAI